MINSQNKIQASENGGRKEKITDQNNDEQLLETLKTLTKNSGENLELFRSLLHKQQTRTSQVVDDELSVERALQFIPQGSKRVILTIAKIFASIRLLLNFKSPFIFAKNTALLLFLERNMAKYKKQRKIYQQAFRQPPNQNQQMVTESIAELDKVTGEIINTLDKLITSKKNEIRVVKEMLKVKPSN